MARDGQAAIIETRGRRTGGPVVVAVGFVEGDEGSLLVAAGEPDADWALNLEADPSCRVTIGGRLWDATAEELPPERGRVALQLVQHREGGMLCPLPASGWMIPLVSIERTRQVSESPR